MNIPGHVAIGGAAALAFSPLLGHTSAVLWASSWLIDMDHYWDYVYRNRFRDLSLRRALDFNWTLNRKIREADAQGRQFVGLSALHTAEFVGLLTAAAALSGSAWVWAAVWGVLLHLCLDTAYLCSQRLLFHRAFSIVEYAVRWNVMKRRGGHPELLYREALAALQRRGT